MYVQLFSLKFIPRVNTPLNNSIPKRNRGKAKDLWSFALISAEEYPLSSKSSISPYWEFDFYYDLTVGLPHPISGDDVDVPISNHELQTNMCFLNNQYWEFDGDDYLIDDGIDLCCRKQCDDYINDPESIDIFDMTIPNHIRINIINFHIKYWFSSFTKFIIKFLTNKVIMLIKKINF